MQQLTELAPVEDWQVESCLIAEVYKEKISQFTFFPAGKKEIILSFSWSEAFAINNYFSATNPAYNAFLRQFLEPQLPPTK